MANIYSVNGKVVFENEVAELQDRVVSYLEKLAEQTLDGSEKYEKLSQTAKFGWGSAYYTMAMKLHNQWCAERRYLNDVGMMDYKEFTNWYGLALWCVSVNYPLPATEMFIK